MGRRVRLAVARLWHEGNSFNPVPVTLEDFRRREWVRGRAAAEVYRATATEMGGVLRFLDGAPGWEAEFLRCTSAPPGGPVEQADLDAIHDEIVEGLSGRPWDAVYLSLHGALLGTQELAPDRRLLQRVRAAVGPDIPVAVSFDMHACLDPRIAALVQVLTGYRTYPHVDMEATALRALSLLRRAVEGEALAVTLRPVPMLPNSHLMRSDAGPMAEMIALAAKVEAGAGLEDATVFGGFAYADSPHAHATIALTHRAGRDVAPVAAQLANAMLTRHSAFMPDMPGAAAGLARAQALLDEGAHRPVAVVETADNPLSGGIGDTTGLFRALLRDAPELSAVFCFFHDPGLVARAHAAGEGAAIHAALGGRIAPQFGPPALFDGRVARLTDGRFVNTGPMEWGMPVDIGRTAVLEAGNLKVIVAETCQSANDPAWCDLHGIDLSQTALFCVKAKNHFRAGFAPLCGAIIEVDTDGPAPADLLRLPFRHVPRHYLSPQEAGNAPSHPREPQL